MITKDNYTEYLPEFMEEQETAPISVEITVILRIREKEWKVGARFDEPDDIGDSQLDGVADAICRTLKHQILEAVSDIKHH